MPPQYDPAAVEPRWAAEWIERGYFQAHLPSEREPYCIVIPPPNVTGRLHIGHALQHSLQDVLVRRARMQGYETLWLPGMDHAGIATQVVVERELRKEGIDRRDIGREAFVERVWQWKEQYGGEIVDQIKRMGNSLDWSRERFTMDEGLSRAVREAFVRWYDEGLIYRGERLVNWCPTDQTGLSDSEVEHEDVDGELVTFRYPLSDGSGSDRGRHHTSGDHARRHGDRGAPRRRTVRTARGEDRHASVRRAPDPDRRRRRDRSRVRDRSREGHAGARPDRLRHRAAGRPAADQHLQRRRDRQRERGGGVLRARTLRRAHRGPRGAGEARPDRRRRPGRTCTPSGIATAVTARSNRGSRACSGSSRWTRCAARRRTRRSTGGSRSGPGAGRRRSSAGWTTSATGTSRASSGGVIASRRGTAPTGT